MLVVYKRRLRRQKVLHGLAMGLCCLVLFVAASVFASAKQAAVANEYAAIASSNSSARVVMVWPTEGTKLSGYNSFQGYAANLDGQDYDLYWHVDDGSHQKMLADSPGDTYKKALVNVDDWQPTGQSAAQSPTPSQEHTITFVAISKETGKQLGATTARVYTTGTGTGGTGQAAVPASQPQDTLSVLTGQTPPNSAFSGAAQPANTPYGTQALYVNPNSKAMQAAQAKTGDPEADRLIQKIAGTPTPIWLGDWNSDVQATVNAVTTDAVQKGQIPMFVTYNIPNRDCGGYSGGGASDYASYEQWVARVAAGIGEREAIVVVEPDALAHSNSNECLDNNQKQQRFRAIGSAITTLKARPKAHVYLDAGNPYWVPAATMGDLLKRANVAAADGFSVNVSNFVDTSVNMRYGSQISSLVGGKHFVIDTSRNGNGYNGEWCNPAGRALGTASTLQTGNGLVDGFLWIKAPGESDGTCRGGPSAGEWWGEYALELARNAGW